jgi:hypothetical protein
MMARQLQQIDIVDLEFKRDNSLSYSCYWEVMTAVWFDARGIEKVVDTLFVDR